MKLRVVLIEDLPGWFDRNMRSDCHGLVRRINDSDAAQALLALGRETLPLIVAHLQSHPNLDELDLRLAWGMLLHDLVIEDRGRNRRRRRFSGKKPKDFKHTDRWIAWAERNLGMAA